MQIQFTRTNIESINLDDSDIRAIIPNLDELEFEEIQELLIRYFWNKDLDETHGLAQWGEEYDVSNVTGLDLF